MDATSTRAPPSMLASAASNITAGVFISTQISRSRTTSALILFKPHGSLLAICIYGADRVDASAADAICFYQERHILAAPQQQCKTGLGKCPPFTSLSPPAMSIPCAVTCRSASSSSGIAPRKRTTPGLSARPLYDDVHVRRAMARPFRRHLPTVICRHLCAAPPALGENWDGHRNQPRYQQ